jgi:DNA-binding transcriptional regulator YdaS (Cro superfamily)
MSTQHDFYVARAAEARADAERATLHNVRERCLRAAAAWDAMAARAHRGDTFRAKQEAEKAALREAEALAATPVAAE